MNDPLEIALISRRTGYLMSEFGLLPGLYSFNELWLASSKLLLRLAEVVDAAFYLVVLVFVGYWIYKLVRRFV